MKACIKPPMSNERTKPIRTLLPIVRSCLIMTALASTAATSSAQIVTNGDFETGSFSGWSQTGGIGIASDAFYFNAYGPFRSGHYAAAFGAGDHLADGALRQTINTTIGQQYELTFDYGKFQAISLGSGDQSINLSVVDTTSQQLILDKTIVDASGDANPSGLLFSPYSYRFSAISTKTTISFADVSTLTSSTDGILDNVRVSAVPEPGAGILAVLGLLFLARTARTENIRHLTGDA